MATQQIKDILNTEIPKPTLSIRPTKLAPLPRYVTHSRSTEAYAFDAARGKYVSFGADTPRTHRGGQGLLLEGTSARNQVLYSSHTDPNSKAAWGKNNISNISAKTSIIKSPDSQGIRADGDGTTSPSFISQNNLEWTGNHLHASLKIEKGFGKIEFHINNKSRNVTNAVHVEYDFGKAPGNRTTNLNGANDVKIFERIEPSKPNNNEIAHLGVMVGANCDSNVQGEIMQLNILVSPENNGEFATIHHVQVEGTSNANRRYATRPIVTTSSPVSRERDITSIEVTDDWFNPNKGTWVIEGAPFYELNSTNPSILKNNVNGSDIAWRRPKSESPPRDVRVGTPSGKVTVPRFKTNPETRTHEIARFAVTVNNSEPRTTVATKTATDTINDASLLSGNPNKFDVMVQQSGVFTAIDFIPESFTENELEIFVA